MSANTGGYNDRPVAGPRFIAGPYQLDALREMRMHAENVHHKDTVTERERRTRLKRYEAMKAELRRVRPTR